jgi:DNA-binding transcriptional regulator YbjK
MNATVAMAPRTRACQNMARYPCAPHYTLRIEKKTTPNFQRRREELCDAAIRVLADEGAKGLSHLKVDRQAAVPEGTTSVHFRTRKALIHAIAARVAELDNEQFTTAMETAQTSERSSDPILPMLAEYIMQASQEPALSRTKARYELLMQAPRDPALMEAFQDVVAHFAAMSREAVAQLQPPDTVLDPSLVTDQAFAITTFINGLMIGSIFGGDRTVESADKLNEYLHAVIDGVAQRHRNAGIANNCPEASSDASG